jgi:hypothetical protein
LFFNHKIEKFVIHSSIFFLERSKGNGNPELGNSKILTYD